MQTNTWYVIKATTHDRKKVDVGDELTLTVSQARPLQNCGFITSDRNVIACINALLIDNKELKAKLDIKKQNKKENDKEGGK